MQFIPYSTQNINEADQQAVGGAPGLLAGSAGGNRLLDEIEVEDELQAGHHQHGHAEQDAAHQRLESVEVALRNLDGVKDFFRREFGRSAGLFVLMRLREIRAILGTIELHLALFAAADRADASADRGA